jgi:hypothetical protein
MVTAHSQDTNEKPGGEAGRGREYKLVRQWHQLTGVNRAVCPLLNRGDIQNGRLMKNPVRGFGSDGVQFGQKAQAASLVDLAELLFQPRDLILDAI